MSRGGASSVARQALAMAASLETLSHGARDTLRIWPA